MRSITSHIVTAIVTATLFLGLSRAYAWTGPSAAPPNSNVSAPINVGTVDQVKNAGLSLNALAVFGNTILSGSSRYLNFGTTAGSGGYGIRDNAGTMQFKNSAGSWTAFGSGSGSLSGAGTANYLAKWSSASALADTILYDNGTNVGIGTTNPTAKLQVAGQIHSSTGGIKFPDGTVQTTAATGGGITAATTQNCEAIGNSCVTPACPTGYFRSGCSMSGDMYAPEALMGASPYGSAQCSCVFAASRRGQVCYVYCLK